MKTFSKSPTESESTRAVVCAVCGSASSELHWQCGAYAFVRCSVCRHIYQNPQPNPQSLLDRYDSEYSDYEVENSQNFLDLMLRGLADVSFFRRMEERGVERSLLDVGCATGALLEHARGRGYEVQGVEVCVPAAEHGIRNRKVPIAIGTLESASLPQRCYGAIHSSHVIEHVPDPRAFLEAARSRLHPDGLLVIVTPNTSGLQSRLFGSRWRSAIADHVNLFNARNLSRLLSETGFRVLATQTWGGLGIGTAPVWVKRPVDRAAKRFGFGDVMLFLSERM